MQQNCSVSSREIDHAKWPHEIFLINLIFNHILVFAATFGVFTTFPLLILIVPAISFIITAYIIIKAKHISKSDESWYVKSHWKIAAHRNRQFLWLLSITCAVIGGGLLISKVMGWSKIPTLALLGGVGLLPFMVSLLILIVLGNESVHLARQGKLPKRFIELNPDPSNSPIST